MSTRQPLTPFQRDALLGLVVVAACFITAITFAFVLAFRVPAGPPLDFTPPAVVAPPAPKAPTLDKADVEAIDKLINAMPAKKPEAPQTMNKPKTAVSVGAHVTASALEPLPCTWQLRDSGGTSWEHKDKAHLVRWVEDRNKQLAAAKAVPAQPAGQPTFSPIYSYYGTPWGNVAGYSTPQYLGRSSSCPGGVCRRRFR